MGTWREPNGNIWSAMADTGADTPRERYRCMVREFSIFQNYYSIVVDLKSIGANSTLLVTLKSLNLVSPIVNYL